MSAIDDHAYRKQNGDIGLLAAYLRLVDSELANAPILGPVLGPNTVKR